MSISKELLLAVLSLDAYNRGYEPGIEGLGIDSASLGPATIRQDANDQEGVARSAGFYAIAYEITGAVEGIAPGTTVISYRGTGRNFTPPWGDFGSDLWNGYGVAAGTTINEQARLAVEFYQSVTGTSNSDPRISNSPIWLTGHSLGGGLAGLVSNLYGKPGLLYDNMTFELAASTAWLRAEVGSTWIGGAINEDAYRIWQDFYNGLEPWAPIFDTRLETIYVNGDFLTVNRLLQNTPQTQLISSASFLNPFTQYHSIALLALLQYSDDEKSELGQDWRAFAAPLWKQLFVDDLGRAVGVPPERDQGRNSEGGKLAAALAYSVLEGDAVSLPFGDTGAAALFDDASDLGKVIGASSGHPILGLETVKEALAQIVVQFAGDLAWSMTLQSDADWALEGTFELRDGDKRLTADLDPEKWASTFTGGEKKIVGLETLAEAVLGRVIEDSAQYRAIAAQAAEVWKQAAAAEKGYQNVTWLDIATVADGATLDGRGAAKNQFDKPGGGIFIGADGGDIILGAPGDDLIIAGNGENIIRFSGGNDLVFGGADDDYYDAGDGTPPPGADTRGNLIFFGGEGFDKADYRAYETRIVAKSPGVEIGGVKVGPDDVHAWTLSIDGTTDRLVSVEDIKLTNKADIVVIPELPSRNPSRTDGVTRHRDDAHVRACRPERTRCQSRLQLVSCAS